VTTHDAPCPCWANNHALGHDGHCCFAHGDRRGSDRFKADEDICHVAEGKAVAR
jgi:hypothetical protein